MKARNGRHLPDSERKTLWIWNLIHYSGFDPDSILDEMWKLANKALTKWVRTPGTFYFVPAIDADPLAFELCFDLSTENDYAEDITIQYDLGEVLLEAIDDGVLGTATRVEQTAAALEKLAADMRARYSALENEA